MTKSTLKFKLGNCSKLDQNGQNWIKIDQSWTKIKRKYAKMTTYIVHLNENIKKHGFIKGAKIAQIGQKKTKFSKFSKN